jgi:hypothetical protein
MWQPLVDLLKKRVKEGDLVAEKIDVDHSNCMLSGFYVLQALNTPEYLLECPKVS